MRGTIALLLALHQGTYLDIMDPPTECHLGPLPPNVTQDFSYTRAAPHESTKVSMSL